MELRCRRVEVVDLDGGPPRFGVLAEAPEGRALIALAAATRDELATQLDAVGGPVAYLRRFGAVPLDPEGIAPGDAGPAWTPPGGG